MIFKHLKHFFKKKVSDQTCNLNKNLEKNIVSLQEIFKNCGDIIFKPIKIGGKISAQLIFLAEMINTDIIDDFLIKPLISGNSIPDFKINTDKDAYKYAKDVIISPSEIVETDDFQKIINYILSGFIALLIENNKKAIIINNIGYEHRNVEHPSREISMKGPKDSFTENLSTNIMLVRRRIKDPNLKIKKLVIGKRSRTEIGVMYVEDIVDKKLVDEVMGRLNKIDIDNVQNSSTIEHLIEDNWLSPFPQVSNTERPDKAAANLLEGRICIIVDNSPYASFLPITLTCLMQVPDDYYEKWMISSMIRLGRTIGIIISLILPSIYIVMLSYNPEMIPTRLALSLSPGRENVPFPAFVEAFVMEGVFELMREAGIRLPGSLGQTIGVVGAVVIGQAAVTANVVSPAMVVIVALTGIANFVIPAFGLAMSFRLLRFFLMMLATVLGLYGIILGILLIMSHLCILKSFGIPYLAPLTTFSWRDLKDYVFRAPLFFLQKRPSFLNPNDKQRMNSNMVNQGKKKGKDDE